MFSVSQLASFALASFVIIVVPGPSVLFVISRGVALGRRAAMATVVGNCLGAFVMALLVSFGLGTLITKSVMVFNLIKWVGAAYLVFLGLKAFRHRRELSMAFDVSAVAGSDFRIIREGFVVGITNPKILIFFASVLPQFVNRQDGSVPLQMVVLALIFQGIALLSDGAWGLLAGTARNWFVGSPKRLEAIGGLGGLAIAGLGVRLALTGRHD
jgi:threonine/homoserine/homoserine lactone efflux protein